MPYIFLPLWASNPLGVHVSIAFKSQHMPRKRTDQTIDDSGKVKDNDWKRENILKLGTWNVQSIAHKEDQLDDILTKKGI